MKTIMNFSVYLIVEKQKPLNNSQWQKWNEMKNEMKEGKHEMYSLFRLNFSVL